MSDDSSNITCSDCGKLDPSVNAWSTVPGVCAPCALKRATHTGDRTARAKQTLAAYTAAVSLVATMEELGVSSSGGESEAYQQAIASRDTLRDMVIIPVMARGFEEV